MKAPSIPLALVCLCSFAFVIPSQARLGDDQATLEERFGKGESIEYKHEQDRGLWSLFDTVLRFEKNGIQIVAGLVDDRCESIVYEVPQSTAEEDPPEGLSWAEVQALMAKNAGEGEFQMNSGNGAIQIWSRPEDSYARLEHNQSMRSHFRRVGIYSKSVYENTSALGEGIIRPEFLRANPPRNLEDF